MITIIVCSVNEAYIKNFKISLDDTIGIPYELLVWDNREKNIPICSVYNKMAGKAHNEILCFIHEDVEFNIVNWGKKIVEIFNNEQSCGVIGVAGSLYKANFFSGWYTGINEIDYINITHRTNNVDIEIHAPHTNQLPFKEVVSVDGVFIACRKKVWQEVKFNETLLKGFHFYDIDFSFRASEICKVVVSYEINLTHITKGGDFGTAWVIEAIKFHGHYNQKLPAYTTIDKKDYMEVQIANTWLNVLKGQKLSFQYKMKWVLLQKLFLYPKLWYGIVKLFLYKPFRFDLVHKKFKK